MQRGYPLSQVSFFFLALCPYLQVFSDRPNLNLQQKKKESYKNRKPFGSEWFPDNRESAVAPTLRLFNGRFSKLVMDLVFPLSKDQCTGLGTCPSMVFYELALGMGRNRRLPIVDAWGFSGRMIFFA